MIAIDAQFLRQMPLPDPQEGDKNARGNALVVAGGPQVPGAAFLAGVAALRAGAGRLQIATCERNATALALAVPEALVLGLPETSAGAIDPHAIERLTSHVEQANAVLLGPGLQDEDAIAAFAEAFLERVSPATPVIFDARAIRALRAMRGPVQRHQGGIVVTPHAGEMAGLLGMERSEVESNPARVAQEVATALGIVVALKGARTFIASPEQAPAVCAKGSVGLATSGSGDVLAGAIAGLLARGAAPLAATCWGVYLHATAGARLSTKIGPLGFLARELLTEIPPVMGELTQGHR